MALHIPSDMEHEIANFAKAEHITREEALMRLIEAGLAAKKPVATGVFEEGLGLFGSPEDASLLDEVVAIAYEERRRPAKPELIP